MIRPRPTRIPAVLVSLAVALALLGRPTAAQDRAPAGTIISDRPGLGDGAWVLAPGVRQIEIGATLEDVGNDRIGVGSALLRWGFAPLELRVHLPSPLVSVEPDGTELGDLGLGVKIPIGYSDGWRWALLGGATLPTGTRGASADPDPGPDVPRRGGTTLLTGTRDGSADDPGAFATLVGETALTEMIGFTLNVGYAGPFDALEDGALVVIATPSVPLSGTMSGYAGYAGFFAGGDGTERHLLEAGVTGASGADTQWDVNGGWDLEGRGWFLGIGVSKRWR